jgi:fumarylacetoacetate (FAA) hydrolase
MKLATLRNSTRDGALVVVSRDLTSAVSARHIVPTCLAALESWQKVSPALERLYADLNAGTCIGASGFDAGQVAPPLPRAPQWLDASAFHSHGDLMEQALGLAPIESKRQVPLMYQGASDDFLGPCEEMPLPSETDGIDFEAELAVVVDFVPMGCPAAQAREHIKLLMLVNDASLRNVAAQEIRTGFGFLQAKPATSFAPVAVTPDELGEDWRDARVHLPVKVAWNGEVFGTPSATQMGFGFDELIAHAARTRNLHPGTIIGSGTISNVEYATVGAACIAERRGREILEKGAPSTAYMRFGDRVRIEVSDRNGHSIFGAIDQQMVAASPP